MDQPKPIEVLPWTANWHDQFANETQRIHHVLPALELHHIGSTSVPGCAAKPIIDIMAVVETLARYPPIHSELVVALGYISLGEYGVVGRCDFLCKYDAGYFHISVFERGSAHVDNNLRFRELLRGDELWRTRYGELKRLLATAHSHDHGAYNEGKASLIVQMLALQNAER